MRKGRVVFNLLVIAVAAYAAFAASGWTFKAALMPLAVSIPLIVLATTQLLLDLFGKAETASGPAVDLDFAADVPPEVARRRVIDTLLWIAGFIALVALNGFPIAVPIFVFLYLRLQSRASWLLSFTLTLASWGFFYGLFIWLLHLPFEDGWIQIWLDL
jgi:hypothetical protein